MAYDPIVEGMFRASGVEAPTYVDDLARLINGPAQATYASTLLSSMGELGRWTRSEHARVPQAYVRSWLAGVAYLLRKTSGEDLAQ